MDRPPPLLQAHPLITTMAIIMWRGYSISRAKRRSIRQMMVRQGAAVGAEEAGTTAREAHEAQAAARLDSGVAGEGAARKGGALPPTGGRLESGCVGGNRMGRTPHLQCHARPPCHSTRHETARMSAEGTASWKRWRTTAEGAGSCGAREATLARRPRVSVSYARRQCHSTLPNCGRASVWRLDSGGAARRSWRARTPRRSWRRILL